MVNKKYNKLLNVLFCICVVLTIVSIGQIISMIIQKRVFIVFYVVSTLLIFCSLLYIIIFAYTKKAFANTLDLKQNVSASNAKTTMYTKRQNYKNYSKDELFLIWCGQNTNKVYRLDSFFNIMKKILLCVLVVVVEIAICLLLNLWKSSYDYLDTNQAIPIIVMSITFFFAIFVITEIIKDSDMSLYKDYFSVVLFDDIEKHITSHELPTKYNPNTFFVRVLKILCNYEKIDLTKYEEKNKKIEADDLTNSHKKTNNLNSNKKNNTKNVEVDDVKTKNIRLCGYASIDEIKAGLENVFNKLSGDFSGAKSAILKEVENGDANAMLNLGNIYLNGSGVELDKKKAYYYYRIAAYMGFASAIGYVGNYYLDEEENLYKSLVWHSIAAKKKNAYAAVRAWQTLCKLSVIEDNMYYSNLSDILASKAMEFGYPLKQKVPAYQPMNFPYSKEEKEVFIKKFNDALKVVKLESKKEQEQIFNDGETPEIIKNKIKSIDIFKQNSSKVITVEEPILGTPLKQSVKYLCEDSEVCVGDLMYFHYLDYVPEPVKIISVLDAKLSKTEREKLYSANYITWLSSNDNSSKKAEIDDYNELGSLINYYKNQFNEKVYEEFNKKMKNIKLSSINFEKLKKDSNDIYKLTEQQDREQNLIIQELCVPLKRSGYLDSANKVYKYIYKTYGFSQVLMNSWAKIFVCNKQFDIAYKLFELGDNQYQYRIKTGDLKMDPATIMIFGGVPISQCCENMKKAERAMNDYQYALQLVKDMGGNPNINNTNKLE